MRSSCCLAVALLTIHAPFVSAQASDPTADPAPPVTVQAPLGPVVQQPLHTRADNGLKARIGRMFTGAVVGGWLGFFASQIAVSDWEEGGRGEGMQRGTWAAAGVVAGAVVGRLLSPTRSTPNFIPDPPPSRSVLTREQIVESGATNAFQLIGSARREWLIPRGLNSWRESARGTAGGMSLDVQVTPGDDHILVYLDNSRIGGTQYLREMHLANIERIEFVSPADATFRWGSGHAHGVIQLITMDGSSEGSLP